jgi:hypothetical protein
MTGIVLVVAACLGAAALLLIKLRLMRDLFALETQQRSN